MSNNLNITVNDFEHICRTCLSREELKSLYDKSISSTCLVDMLMSLTSVKFIEDDGLPVKICANCIYKINEAFSFVKCCEITDSILRNCMITQFNTGIANSSTQFLKDEPIIEAKEEIKIKLEIIEPDVYPTEEVLQSTEFVAVKQEEELIIKNDDSADESYGEEDEDQEGSETSDNPGCGSWSTNSQIKKQNSKNVDGLAKKLDVDHERLDSEKEKSTQILSRGFQCTECDRAFTTSKSLREHLKIHQEKQYSCIICGKSFVAQVILYTHSKSHTPPYACYVCGKEYNYMSSLTTHQLIHTGEKPYVCSVCEKSFIHRQSLKNHMIIHSGLKPYTCGLCNKTFTQSNNLDRHMRTHTGEKPFSCEICGKTFFRKSVLVTHTRIHTGEKPHICSFCGKGFYGRNGLVRHNRIHEKQK